MLLSLICTFYSCDSDSDEGGSGSGSGSGSNKLTEVQMASYGTHKGRKLASIEYEDWGTYLYEFNYNDKGIITQIECTKTSSRATSKEILDSYTFSERLDTLVRDRRLGTPKLYTYVLNYDKKGRVTNLRTVKSSDYEHNITATFSYDGNGYLKSYNSLSSIEWENGCPNIISTKESDETYSGYSTEYFYDQQLENKFDMYCFPFSGLTDKSGPHEDMKPLDILSILGMLGNAPKFLPTKTIHTRYRRSNDPYISESKYSYSFYNDNSGFIISNEYHYQRFKFK